MSFFVETLLITYFLENSTQLLNLIIVKIHTFNQYTSDSEFTEKAAVIKSHLTIMITLSIKKKRAHNLNMSTITCSDLSTELLSFFSNNLIIISETDFLFLVKKYLFLTISFFQN